MTRSQKRNLLITLGVILLLIATLVVYWVLIQFNPFQWIAENVNYFIVGASLGGCALLVILGYWLSHRKRL